MQKTIPIIATALAVLLCGCERESDIPPANAGDGGGLPPVTVRKPIENDPALGAAASGDEPEAAEGEAAPEGGSGVTAGDADTSTPEATVQAFKTIIDNNALDRLPGIVVPEQREAVQLMVDLVSPMMAAQERFDEVWAEKFGDAPSPLSQASGPAGSMDMGPKPVEIVSVEPDSDDPNLAKAELRETVENGKEMTLNVQLHDGAWLIEMPADDMPPPDQFSADSPIVKMFEGMATGLEEVAARIEADEFADAQAAGQAVGEAMAEAMGPLMESMMGNPGESGGPGGE